MKQSRARALALRRRRDPMPWLPWLVLASLLVAGTAFGQTSANPPTGPQSQSRTPPPSSAGRGTDTPGGSATNGVITPPAMTDPGMAKPAPRTGTMPVVPPPGHAGSNAPAVVPK
jgi:hypothetical protein